VEGSPSRPPLIGLLVIFGSALLVTKRDRRTVVVLSGMYLCAWIGLLAWNAERARHFLGEGI
jgi:UDP-N-acetylmuramyl pentapeptide phosphotransferase/UDP-N-acetylglucosamine-1-phosphate transferase